MSEWRVTIKALISIDDPQTLDKLILCRMKIDESGEEVVSSLDDDFEVIEYPNDWLDFTEVMKNNPDIKNDIVFSDKQYKRRFTK